MLTFDNDSLGIAKLVEHLQARPNHRVVLEATGGYETPLVVALFQAGLPVIVVNPRNVRAFATATGELAKTDPIDARILARFGHDLKPECRPLPSEKERHFAGLATRRRQLIALRTAEKNRRKQTVEADLQASIDAVLKILGEQIELLEQRLSQLIAADDQWKERDHLLQSVSGVGPTTSHALIADLPELGKLDDRKLAKLVGLAPLNRDSGKLKRPRIIFGGRASVRATLYMATFNAYRRNPQIREFYQRLRANGKPFKVALTACMHKLLTILNAIVRNKTPWKNPMTKIATNT
jgi:transposase